MNDSVRILYIDDEEHNLQAFKANFRRDFKIFTAISGAEGLEIFKKEPDLNIILTDQRMPNMTGIEFLEEVQKIDPEPMRILITGYSDINAVIDAINRGQVYRYLNKPWHYDDLKSTILAAHEVFNLRRQNKTLVVDLAEANDLLERANNQLEFLLRQKLLS
jgi:response regulator RpfG family c-di-GMP phosphodiesterase